MKPDGRSQPDIVELETLGGAVLGRHLAENYAGQTVGVILAPPGAGGGTGLSTPEQAMLAGLKAAFADAGELRMVRLAAPPSTDPPLWYPAALFDQAFGQCMDCAAIVTLAGMPEKLADLRFWWRDDSPPPLIIANSPILQLKQVIAKGEIAAALIRRPWLPGEREHRGENQWLVITTGNLEEISAKYKSLFAKE